MNNAASITIAVVLLAAVALAVPTRSRLRLTDAFIHALYRWARFWLSFAVAADKAVLHFRLTRTQTEIRPECGYGVGRS